MAWAVSRVALIATTWVGGLLLTAVHPQGSTGRLPPDLGPMSLGVVLSRWPLWDGDVYLGISVHGYTQPIQAAFFPLYPFLIHLVELVPGVGSTYVQTIVAGLIVSNLGSLGAFVALALLACELNRFAIVAERAVWALVAYPLALFLAAIYTDGLFLALACAVLLALLRGAWGWAALWLLLASLTRPTAAALVPCALFAYGTRISMPQVRVVWRAACAGTASWWRVARTGLTQGIALVGVASPYVVALALIALICWRSLGDPLAFIHAQHAFGIVAQWPWQTIGLVWQDWRTLPVGGWQQVRVLADIVPVVLLGALTISGWRERPVALSLYLCGVFLLILSAPIASAQFPDPLAGGGRFVLAAAPLWVDMGRWMTRWPWLERAALPLGWVIQALLVVFVVTGGWLI